MSLKNKIKLSNKELSYFDDLDNNLDLNLDIYNKLRADLINSAFHLLPYGYKDFAEDVVQEIFLRVYSKYGLSGINRSLMFKCLKNYIKDFKKSKNRENIMFCKLVNKVFLVEDIDRLNEDDILEKIFSSDIFNSLDIEDRELLVLYCQGYSFEEIGEFLSINKFTVKTRFYRLINGLKDQLSIYNNEMMKGNDERR